MAHRSLQPHISLADPYNPFSINNSDDMLDVKSITNHSFQSSLLHKCHRIPCSNEKYLSKKCFSNSHSVAPNTNAHLENTSCSFSRQPINEFIYRKREMFLVEYGLNVKRDDLLHLEQTASDREDELIVAEKLLEEDATNFDEFLRNTNLITQKTVSSANNYVEQRLQKSNYCQKLITEIILHKAEISKNNDLLTQLQTYELFLRSLTISDAKIHSKYATNSILQVPEALDDSLPIHSIFLFENSSSSQFKSSLKLLDILSVLEENNLSLILNSQEVEEALEHLIHASKFNRDRLLQKVNSLTAQISLIESNIHTVHSHANNLEIKAKMFSYGEFKEEDQDYLANIDRKVQKVYMHCIGYNEANIGTLQMLSSVENRVEELFDILDGLPADKVKDAELARGKERRIKLRERKIEEEKCLQDDRIRRSLARANAYPRILTGRRLIYRSNPPKQKPLKRICGQKKDREDEDQMYFFS